MTLVSDHPLLYYSGMVPEWSAGVYAREQATIDLEAWCEATGVTWVQGRVVSLDKARRTVQLDSKQSIRGDLLVFDIGVRTRGAGVAPGAMAVKPLHRAEALRTFLETAPARQSMVVVGGGAAGTELALNISARRPDLKLHVIEPQASLLFGMPERAGLEALHLLEARGVKIHFGTSATHSTPEGVGLSNGNWIPSRFTVWATGPEPQPIFREAGLPVDVQGYVHVSRSLQVPGYPWLFAAGDCAKVQGYEHLPRIGVHAVKQGPVLVHNVRTLLEAMREGARAARLRSFRPYAVAPLILSTGSPKALFITPNRISHSRWALRAKHWADLRWLRLYQPEQRWPVWTWFHARHAEPLPLMP